MLKNVSLSGLQKRGHGGGGVRTERVYTSDCLATRGGPLLLVSAVMTEMAKADDPLVLLVASRWPSPGASCRGSS